MSISKEAKLELSKLVEKYEADIKNYQSAKYNETQLRTDFLDPFFAILDWDINNKE